MKPPPASTSWSLYPLWQWIKFDLLDLDKVGFPLWSYLKQQVGDRDFCFNPVDYWYQYRNQFLEQCWHQDYHRLLEQCWLLPPHPPARANSTRHRTSR